MGVAASARLVGAAVAWRRLGVPSAGRALARALTLGEQERTVAGIGLVQAGERSVAVLEAELERRGPSVLMVRVLADIGGPDAVVLLRRIAESATEAAPLAREVLARGSAS